VHGIAKIGENTANHMSRHETHSKSIEKEISNSCTCISNLPFLPTKTHIPAKNEIQHLSKEYPFYYAKIETLNKILRKEITFPPPKKYEGFNRLSQALRHVSSAVMHSMKKNYHLKPVEIQASIISNKLHISSNFHSDKIAIALTSAITQKTNDECEEQSHLKEQKSHKVREKRHIKKLTLDYLQQDGKVEHIITKAAAEIKSGKGIPKGSNLSYNEIIIQFKENIRALQKALKNAAEENYSDLIIDSPHHDERLIQLSSNDITETRHAERNIGEYIAQNQSTLYGASLKLFNMKEGKHIIIPIEGRFIPCGACHEQEAEECLYGGGGIFDAQRKKFILHRAGERVGKFYPNEIQHFSLLGLDADPEVAMKKGKSISSKIWENVTSLHTYGKSVVETSSLNTDSEDSEPEIY